MFNFDWICRLEYFLHPGESYGSPAADPVSTYNEVSQVSHQTIAWPSTKTYIWSQKLITHSSGTWKLWGTLCGPGHRIQRQRLQQQQQQRASSRSSWQLWHSPRGPFHRGGSSRSPNRSNAMIIMFTLFSNIQKSGSFVIANKRDLTELWWRITTGYGVPLEDPVTTYEEPAVPASDSYGVIIIIIIIPNVVVIIIIINIIFTIITIYIIIIDINIIISSEY